MARKIKIKKQVKQSNQGKIILISTACFLGAIAILLIILAIVQNTGKKEEDQQQISTVESSSVSEEQSVVSEAEASLLDSDLMNPEYLQDVDIDLSKIYYADIDVKDYGTITVELNSSVAPITMKNFVYLAQKGFYNGLTFHRIMDSFMIQGGDPSGNGTGGSENNIYGEFAANGYEGNTLSHTRGVISMARRSDDYNSASSQFFIVQSDDHTATLDGNYAAFGKVTTGMEIVDAIAKDAKPTDDNGTIPAEEQPVINSITIRTTDIIT